MRVREMKKLYNGEVVNEKFYYRNGRWVNRYSEIIYEKNTYYNITVLADIASGRYKS